jgi:hypothetical protein
MKYHKVCLDRCVLSAEDAGLCRRWLDKVSSQPPQSRDALIPANHHHPQPICDDSDKIKVNCGGKLASLR